MARNWVKELVESVPFTESIDAGVYRLGVSPPRMSPVQELTFKMIDRPVSDPRYPVAHVQTAAGVLRRATPEEVEMWAHVLELRRQLEGQEKGRAKR